MFVLRILCNDCTAVQNSTADSQNRNSHPVANTCTVHCNPVTVTQCWTCIVQLSAQVVNTSTITFRQNMTNLLLLNFERKEVSFILKQRMLMR